MKNITVTLPWEQWEALAWLISANEVAESPLEDHSDAIQAAQLAINEALSPIIHAHAHEYKQALEREGLL